MHPPQARRRRQSVAAHLQAVHFFAFRARKATAARLATGAKPAWGASQYIIVFHRTQGIMDVGPFSARRRPATAASEGRRQMVRERSLSLLVSPPLRAASQE